MSDSSVPPASHMLGTVTIGFIGKVSTEDILQAVCQYFGLTKRGLIGDDEGTLSRTSNFLLARWVMFWMIRIQNRKSYAEIAADLGMGSHSTVSGGIRRWNELREGRRNHCDYGINVPPLRIELEILEIMNDMQIQKYALRHCDLRDSFENDKNCQTCHGDQG